MIIYVWLNFWQLLILYTYNYIQVRQEVKNNFIYICDSQDRDIFLGILYGYKAALQIVAILFAFSIHKVKVKGLDDTLYVVAAVYIMSIVTAVIIVATYTLNEYIDIFAAVFCTGIFIGTTVILALVFIPKVKHFSISCS